MKFDQATTIWREVEVGMLKQEWGGVFKGKKVLDLGCGEGEIGREIFNKGDSFVKGLDNDVEMVEKAKKSGVYEKVLLADGGEMPVEDESMDLVFSNSVLEHITHMEKVLKEVSRVLNKGGLLVATMPSYKLGEYIGWGGLYGWLFNKKYSHFHLYSKEKWEKLLKEAGMELIDSYYYLDREMIRCWHKCLWLEKFGMKCGKIDSKIERLSEGAGVAIKARKI